MAAGLVPLRVLALQALPSFLVGLEGLALLVNVLLGLDIVAGEDASRDAPAGVSFSHFDGLSQHICLALHEVRVDGHSSVCVDALDLIETRIAQVVLDPEENGLEQSRDDMLASC